MKSLIFAIIATFVVTFVFDFVLHGIMLDPMYQDTAHLWRAQAEMQAHMPYMFVSQLLFSVMFAFIFTRHYEGKGVAEGLRYGLYMGLFVAALQFGSYAYMPIPFALAAAWMAGSVVWGVLAGMVLSFVYKPEK